MAPIARRNPFSVTREKKTAVRFFSVAPYVHNIVVEYGNTNTYCTRRRPSTSAASLFFQRIIHSFVLLYVAVYASLTRSDSLSAISNPSCVQFESSTASSGSAEKQVKNKNKNKASSSNSSSSAEKQASYGSRLAWSNSIYKKDWERLERPGTRIGYTILSFIALRCERDHTHLSYTIIYYHILSYTIIYEDRVYYHILCLASGWAC
jgi:hypothetical protein